MANIDKAWSEGPPPEDKGDNSDCWAAGLEGTRQPRAPKAKDGKEAAECTSWTEMLPPRIQSARAQPPRRAAAPSDPASARPKEGTRGVGLAACLRKMYK